MTKKITLSVQDDLYQKMQEWKDSFNYSQVFQKAVYEAIKKREDFKQRYKKEGKQMEGIIERLRQERLDTEGDYFAMGKEEGFEWAKSAHYDDLKYAAQWNPCMEKTSDEHFGDYFHEIIREDELMGFEDDNEYTDQFIAGWKEAVEEFWDEIKDKILHN